MAQVGLAKTRRWPGGGQEVARCEGQHAIGMRRLRRLVGRRPVRVGQRTLRGYSGHCGTHKPFASRHQLECGGGGVIRQPWVQAQSAQGSGVACS